MFDCRFSQDCATDLDLSENVTDIASARRAHATKSAEAPMGRPDVTKSNPFPDVDDIADRLSNRIAQSHDRLSAAS